MRPRRARCRPFKQGAHYAPQLDIGEVVHGGGHFARIGGGILRPWAITTTGDDSVTTTAKAKHGPEFGRQRLPERFCNLDRLLADMEARALDGLVVTTPLNVFWLTSFNGIAHKGDEPRPYVVILARREPEHPILVLAEYYLTTPLHQPTWGRGTSGRAGR